MQTKLPQVIVALITSNKARGGHKSRVEFFWLLTKASKAEAKGLFNPRRDNWKEHFRFNPTTFEMEGLTEIGRGTVNRLQINSRMQIRARQLWIRFGIFP